MELSLIKKASLIYQKLYKSSKSPIAEEMILEILTFFHRDKLEVPYILIYKPGKWKSFGFVEDDLYKILKQDKILSSWMPKIEKIKNLVDSTITANVKLKSLLLNFLETAEEWLEITDLCSYLRYLSAFTLKEQQSEFLNQFSLSFTENNVSSEEQVDFSLSTAANDENEKNRLTKEYKNTEEDFKNKNLLKKPTKMRFDLSQSLLNIIRRLGTSVMLCEALLNMFKEGDMENAEKNKF